MAADVAPNTVGFALLLRLKLTMLRNLLAQSIQNSPLKLAVSAVFVEAIWLGLFGLFVAIFHSFQTSPMEAAVIIPVVFNLFFLALLILLSFSNAVIVYGSLYGRNEPSFLLAAPVHPTHLVALKYVESLFFASWSLILLGLPLMMAMARSFEESTEFYPLFVAFFIFFVPIPGAVGLLLAWAAARFFPKQGHRALAIGGAALFVVAAVGLIRTVRQVEGMTDQWMAGFFAGMEFIQGAMLPSTWISRGIELVLRQRHVEALGYLAVTLANGLFLSMIAIMVCGRSFTAAYNRATSGSSMRLGSGLQRPRWLGTCEDVFFYLPQRLRLIAAKDLRTFLRDPLQWSQLVILFGLMALYLLNVPRFYGEWADTSWALLLPFLNLSAVSLMLATFTSRFVFPLVSLEGHQLWLLGPLPLSRGRILLAKFAYAATVTVPFALSATAFAARSLKVSWPWALINLAGALTITLGLCGLAVGLGARLPMFGQRNAGRIANGFGGTVNLIVSMFLVMIVLAGFAAASIRAHKMGLAAPDAVIVRLIAATVVTGLGIGAGAMLIGARHFSRLEL